MNCIICGLHESESRIQPGRKKCDACNRIRAKEIKELKEKGLYEPPKYEHLKNKQYKANVKTDFKQEDGVDYKLCPVCKEWKCFQDYHFNDKTKYNLSYCCKLCKKEKDKADNIKHFNKRSLSKKEYSLKNKERLRSLQRIKRKIPHYKLRHSLSTRLRVALRSKNLSKCYKTMDLLGCSMQDFKIYIESKFTEGMSFDNYGQWHIDHIKPCSSFNLADPEEQKKCFHFSNLQPLWWEDNLRKSDKLDWKKNESNI